MYHFAGRPLNSQATLATRERRSMGPDFRKINRKQVRNEQIQTR